ncbi:HAD family hydrolase [Rehaibacterium terrae]|jgi:putative hydrolase of the HAD superfamily|uniref:Putative hydrolase of the HAD superfamily n=1 Tax=Rehaibacterium terrae TaxID=1341696 RepID=A0A7W8DEA8_9GAMM|nr:HAD family hydrolase [Rehaibacterium terrae]MBB5015379.1 putative hydrolase of the HAD superfamily [Rehaibacterium terrae]
MVQLVGFDGDDTLWHSEGYYQAAGEAFRTLLSRYVDLDEAHINDVLLSAERRNLKLFGYGAKGMTLSMIETAIEVTAERISAADIHRIVALGKEVLAHPVELLPGIRTAVESVAVRWPVVLITKGDLFHQEAKIASSGLADVFTRIEIVSEKNPECYARVLRECGAGAEGFVMVGNSLRSDIEPVVRLGGWGVHMPYHVTWAHELENGLQPEHASRVVRVSRSEEIPGAVARIAAVAA